jgi:hypothetical protein
MMTVFLASVALVGQGRDEMDGTQRRRIFEAANAARGWADWKAKQLIPDITIVQSSGRRRGYLEREQAQCRYYLTEAAMKQVCKDYKISSKTLERVVSRPDLARMHAHVPEYPVPERFRKTFPRWRLLGTAFRPKSVRLKPSLAKRFGFVFSEPDLLGADGKPRAVKPNPILEELIGPNPDPVLDRPSPPTGPADRPAAGSSGR